jgi:transcriptional regulator with XRE-family HTH domain
MESIHHRIKRLRESKGLTLEAFASAVGVSYQSVQHWERQSGTAPTRKRMPSVAAALGVSVEYLTGGDTSADSIKQMAAAAEDKMLGQLIDIYGELDQQFRDKLINEANWMLSIQLPKKQSPVTRYRLTGASKPAPADTARTSATSAPNFART